MKRVFSFLLIVLNACTGAGQPFPKSQVIIPLNNTTGVPYGLNTDISSEYYVSGFEVDNAGNFYFMGGVKKNCLAVFAGKKPLRRTYYESNSGIGGSIYLMKDTLYSFDSFANKLVLSNPTTGQVIKTYKNKIEQNVGDYKFALGRLIISEYMVNPLKYHSYTLTGKALSKVENAYGLPFIIPSDQTSATFLGIWEGKYVFHATVGDKYNDVFFVTDSLGRILQKRVVNDASIFGDVFAEDPEDLRTVKNGNLYLLGHKQRFALVTIVPLKTFFATTK